MMHGTATFVDSGRRTTFKWYNLCSTVEILTTRDGPAVIDAKARYWSNVAIFAQVRRVPDEILPYKVWYGKARMVWLPSACNVKSLRIYTKFYQGIGITLS